MNKYVDIIERIIELSTTIDDGLRYVGINIKIQDHQKINSIIVKQK